MAALLCHSLVPYTFMPGRHLLCLTMRNCCSQWLRQWRISIIGYVLTVSSDNGFGIAKDTMHVFVFKDIFIRKTFSPNGDGLNDTWRIPVLAAFPAFELTAFNRLGQKVFQNKNVNIPWDGTFKGNTVSAGAYVYMIDLKQFPGVLKGTVPIDNDKLFSMSPSILKY
jgi:gliding motility-associated-like protein